MNQKSPLIEATDRIAFLDGFKGMAAMMVLLSHLVLAFFPILHSTDSLLIEKHSMVVRLFALTPLSLIYSGHFAVNCFFLITGYVLSYKYFITNNSETITSGAFRRYFRLMLPAFVSCIIAYFLLKFDLFQNIDTASLANSAFLNIPYHFKPDFPKMMQFALYDVFFFKFDFQTGYNNVLWIMCYEFFGSMLIFAFLSIFGRFSRRSLLYLVLIFLTYNSYYLAFILGMCLSDFNTRTIPNGEVQNRAHFLQWIILMAGLYLASFKSASLPFYRILDIDWINYQLQGSTPIYLNAESFFNIIGAFLILYVTSRSFSLKKIMSNTIALYLGRISFSIYLLHLLIICSISCYLFKTMMIRDYSLEISFVATSLITIALTIGLSNLFYHFFEKKSILWINILYKRLV